MSRLLQKVSLLLVLLCPGCFRSCVEAPCSGGPSSRLQVIQELRLEPYTGNIANYSPNEYYYYTHLGKALSVAGYTPLVAARPTIPGFRLFPAAYACDPVMPMATTYYTSIHVIARQAGSLGTAQSWLAGDTITSFFRVLDTYTYNKQAIPDFLTQHDRLYIDQELVFYASTQPVQPVELIFDLAVTMVDGRQFSFSNQKLRIR